MPEPQEQKGPWEKFAAPVPTAGPWDKYKEPKTKTPKAQAVTAKPDVEKSPEEKSEFGSAVERSFGFDPQKMTEAFHKGGAKAQWHELGGEFVHNLKEFGVNVLKDPLTISKGIEALTTGIDTGASKMLHGKVSEGAGQFFGSVAQVLGGAEGLKKVSGHSTVVDGGLKAASDVAKTTGKDVGEATTTAAKLSSGVPSRILHRRAFEDAYVHAKGLEVGQKLTKAVGDVDKEIKTHAEGLAKEIDTKIPTGIINAADEAATIKKEFADVVKTPDKVHPALIAMLRDAQAVPPKLWSWEKTRQFRSSVGRAIGKVQGPQEKVLTKVYLDLTKKLSGVAEKYGLEKSWKQYNELAMKMDKQYGDLVDDVKESKSGEEIAKKLARDPGLTSEFTRNLTKYGLKHDEIVDFIKTSQRVLKNRGFWNKTLFRLVYSSPTGAATMIGARLAGAPWMAGLGAGALVGLTTSYLVNLARVMKLSPEVIEHMMKERELPGRMKFEEGKFPGEEPPQISAPKETPKIPPQLPAPKPESKPEVKKAEPGEHGTGKLAEQAKARERVSKTRALAKRSKESEAAEAQARAQAQHLDVSALQIPELEDYVRTKNPTAYSGLQKLRKQKGITDDMYHEALKYYVLEGLEE